jgi:hypothetical protein
MTPAEVKGRIKAHEIAQKRAVEDADVLAWLIGSYVAHGFHDPKHYPKKPNVVARAKPLPKGTMDDDDIKDALTVFAQTHNAAEKGKTHANYT